MDMVPNELRKRIALIVVEKLNAYCKSNKGRKNNLSSTYVPFYDKYAISNPMQCVPSQHEAKSEVEQKIAIPSIKNKAII